MRFDPLSFVLGFLSSTGISLAIWRYRARLAAIQESAETQIEGTRQFVGRAADTRYYRDMLRYLQRQHVAGNLFNLTDLLLEPHLLLPVAPITLPPEGEVRQERDVFDVIPVYHDLPQSYAPYNIATITLDDLGAGDRHVAILGLSGMGKSTALTTLALMALGEVEFESLEDLTQKAIEEEEKSLTRQEREQRAKEREQIEARVMEKLHDIHQQEREQTLQAQAAEHLPPIAIRGLLPIPVHLNDIDFDVAAYGGKAEELDPAEPLARALQQHVTGVTAQVVGSVIYPALETGRAIVLIDGYDELAPAARDTYFYWLEQLLAAYGHNMIVIAGPVEGYETLVNLGFTPCFLRAWTADDYTRLANRWGRLWPTLEKGRRRAETLDEQTLRRITVDNRGRGILDVTLKIWTGLADDAREAGCVGWYDAWITRKLSNAGARQGLPHLAQAVLEAGCPLNRAALQDVLAQAFAVPEGSKSGPKTEGIIDDLVKDGLLLAHPNGTFSFPHLRIAGYLASEVLVEAGSEFAAECALEPAWQDALGFAASRINMTPVVYRKLSTAPDLLYSNLFDVVRWLPDAPVDAPWRGDLFKRLAAALMAPEQYPAVRERAMAALIAARDRNVLFVLRQALRSADPQVRRLACVGLGALGDPDAIKDLMPFLGDEDEDVQLTAALALGAIGTDRALEIMVHGLIEGSEELRRAVAEALAAIPGEGHAVLRDGIQSDDIMIRRATVYGLSRVRASWALVALYRTMLEDEQWYVRTAAEDAFTAARSPENDGPRAHPEADSLGWLIHWAADRGEGVPAGVNARQILVRVLQEGQPMHKIIAARTLGNLGHVGALKPLYAALRDRHPQVRGAAYAALADLQMRLGAPLPGLA